MIAMRYGTLPIVHAVGGLKDSVTDCGRGRGQRLPSRFNAADMSDAICRAELLHQDKEVWREVVGRAMKTDFSWKKSGGSYRQVYRR
jgi:starch synthase